MTASSRYGTINLKQNIALFYLYRISSRFYFHLPILFPFFFSVDMGIILTEILLATYGLSIMLASSLNLSTRLLRYLRQRSVIATGEICKALGLALIVFGTRVAYTNFWIPLIGQILGGFGFSIAISTDTSLLRSITADTEAEGSFNKIQAQTQSYMFISTLVAGSTGSILFDYEAHWPFYASIGFNLIAITAIWLIHGDQQPTSRKTFSQQETDLVLDPEQKFWINFYAISRSFTLAPFVGFLPFFFVMLGVDPYLFGAVLGLFSVGAFFSARYSSVLLSALGIKFFLPIITSSMLMSMFLFACFDYFPNYFGVGLVAIALLGWGAGGVRPLSTSNLKLAALTPQQRGQVLSSMERRFGIINACMLIAGSWLLTSYNFQTLMFGFAGLYILLFVLLVVARVLKV